MIQMPRVLLSNSYSASNRGDFWIESVTIALLGEQLGDVTLARVYVDRLSSATSADTYPWAENGGGNFKQARRLVSLLSFWCFPTLYLRCFAPRILDLYRSSDITVMKGGSYILSWKGISGWLYLLDRLSPIRAASASGVPVVLAGVSLGPFGGRFMSRFARWQLAKAERVLVRDPPSADYVPAPLLRIVPDIVLSSSFADLLRLENASSKGDSASTNIRGGTPLLGFSGVGSNYLDHHLPIDFVDVYASALIDLADRLGAHLVPLTQVTGPSLGDDDRPMLRRLGEAINRSAPGTCIRSEPDDEATSLTVLQTLDGLVSIRFHLAVAAILCGVPTAICAYLSSKTEGLKAYTSGVAILEPTAVDALADWHLHRTSVEASAQDAWAEAFTGLMR